MPSPKGKLVTMGGKLGYKRGLLPSTPDGLQCVGEILATEYDHRAGEGKGS